MLSDDGAVTLQTSFIAENSGDNAGISVSTAGDVDGDGLDDLFVGAPLNDDGSRAAGKAYLATNGKKEGVNTTSTGLQYRVITEGDGASPKATDRVTVHYSGKLIDGTEFDSSYKRNSPATFPLNGVIPGWTEGLQLMKVGGKSELVIPSELGYGARGAPGAIPPHSTLIFEVELIKIN